MTVPLDRLVASQAAMNAAHFLALPVLALHFASIPEIGIEAAGLALGLFLGVARIGPIVTGFLADRIGVWTAIRLGLALRTLGLVAVPAASSESGAYLAAFVLGLGVALHEPAVYGALGQAPADRRDRLLLRHLQALNVGCVIGPAFALLAGFSTSTSFLVAAGVTALIAIWSFTANVPAQANKREPSLADRMNFDWRYAAFAAALVPFWALFAQLFAALPILVANAGGTSAWAQSVILVNGLVGIVIVPLILPILRNVGPRPLLICGCCLAAGSIGFLDVFSVLWALMLLVVLLSVAETVVTSAADILTARHADGADVAGRFGILAVGAGIGTSIGAPLGVLAADGTPMVLGALGAFGLISCAAAFALPQNQGAHA